MVHLAHCCLWAVVLHRSSTDACRAPQAVLGAETFERDWEPVFSFCSSEQARLTNCALPMFCEIYKRLAWLGKLTICVYGYNKIRQSRIGKQLWILKGLSEGLRENVPPSLLWESSSTPASNKLLCWRKKKKKKKSMLFELTYNVEWISKKHFPLSPLLIFLTFLSWQQLIRND